MIIIEHKQTGDITHIVQDKDMDNYIRTKLEPGIYFTIKGRAIAEPDKTYKTPTS